MAATGATTSTTIQINVPKSTVQVWHREAGK
jgi:hypothetical protein